MQLGLEARRKGEERFLSPRPGAQKPCAGKSRVAPFGMTIGVGDARYPGLTAWAKLCRAYSAQEKEARHGRRPLQGLGVLAWLASLAEARPLQLRRCTSQAQG